MPKNSTVAILRTKPATVLNDYHKLLNLAGYQDVIAKDADTALKMNISWHFFYPGSSTVPWQLEGVIQAMLKDGYKKDLIHTCHNRTVVIDAKLGDIVQPAGDTRQIAHAVAVAVLKAARIDLVNRRAAPPGCA